MALRGNGGQKALLLLLLLLLSVLLPSVFRPRKSQPLLRATTPFRESGTSLLRAGGRRTRPRKHRERFTNRARESAFEMCCERSEADVVKSAR